MFAWRRVAALDIQPSWDKAPPTCRPSCPGSRRPGRWCPLRWTCIPTTGRNEQATCNPNSSPFYRTALGLRTPAGLQVQMWPQYSCDVQWWQVLRYTFCDYTSMHLSSVPECLYLWCFSLTPYIYKQISVLCTLYFVKIGWSKMSSISTDYISEPFFFLFWLSLDKRSWLSISMIYFGHHKIKQSWPDWTRRSCSWGPARGCPCVP